MGAGLLILLFVGLCLAFGATTLFDRQGGLVNPLVGARGQVGSIPSAANSGGATPYHYKNGSTFTAQLVKAGPTVLYGLNIWNGAGAATFIQCFDAASASAVTPGTDKPIAEFQVPATTQSGFPLPAVGVQFNSGLVIFASTASEGGTGSAANVSINADYS